MIVGDVMFCELVLLVPPIGVVTDLAVLLIRSLCLLKFQGRHLAQACNSQANSEPGDPQKTWQSWS